MSEETPKKPHVVGYLYDPVIAVLTERVITSRLGYTMRTLQRAAEAIPHISEADVVISDVSYGGYDVYAAARKHNKPIIFIDGGFLELEKVPDAIVLPKPYEPSQLEQAVRKCAESLKPKAPQ